jgi:hypothetical protein
MTVTRRRWVVPGFLLAVALGTGCNMLSLPFFLLGPEPKDPAVLKKITPEDKKKEARVVILTYVGTELRSELLRADRDLSEKLAEELREAFKADEEKVSIVQPRKVQEFKNQHPGWKDMDLEEIGKHFSADYVIYLEIEDLNLYKQGSFNDLYQGHLRIAVTLMDVKRPDESPQTKEFDCKYPTDTKGGASAVDIGKGPEVFREEFLRYAAKQLSWYFVDHPTRDGYTCQ